MREEAYGEIIGPIPGLDFDLESVESLADRAEKSAEAYAKVAKKRVSPVDQRLADALVDLARAVDRISTVAASDRARIDGVEKTLDSIDKAAKGVEETGYAIRADVIDTVDAAFAENRSSLRAVESAADDAMSALEELNVRAESKYAEAVDESCKRLVKATRLAVAAILTAAMAGVFAAALGAFWLTSANPAIQRLIAENGLLAFMGVIGTCAIAVFLIWCFVTRRR